MIVINKLLKRKTLVFLIGILNIFIFSSVSNAQNLTGELHLSFVKDTGLISSGELHFNALKIVNTTQRIISGTVRFNLPDGWRLFGLNDGKQKINPLDTVYVPIQISPVFDALGGITYILNASFKTPEKTYSANSYLTIPETSSWLMEIEKSSIFVSDENPGASLFIKLSNKGNTNELIKLEYAPGKLIQMGAGSNEHFTDYINLPAFRDTVIEKPFTYRLKLSSADRERFENNWRESTVITTGSTDSRTIVLSNIVKKLNSDYTLQRYQRNSPLNFDYNIYNIMSNQEIRNNLRLYGSILFPKNREIQYNAGLQNIFFSRSSNQSFDVNRQLIYNVRYIDKSNNVLLGYNVFGGSLHSVNGRGVVGSFSANKTNQFSYTLTQNPFTDNIGGNVGYNTTIKNVSFNTELTYETNIHNTYNGTSVLVGAGFTLFKYHNINFQLLASRAAYNSTGQDTSVLGLSYKINYNLRYKNFDLRFSGLNSAHNYIQNAGLQQYYLDSKYIINNRFRIALYGTHNLYSTTRYPYNFYSPANYNSTDNLRLTAILATTKGVTYQFGPNYVGTMRQQHNLLTTYTTEYKTYLPGLWFAASVKIDPLRSISPNVTISNMRFNYRSDNPASTNFSSNEGLYYSVGLNYSDMQWKVNAYYSSGSVSDIYRSIELYSTTQTTKSLQIRPVYENYFFNKQVKLSAFVNLAYYLPSERQNITYNIKYDHYFKKGWNLYLSGYLFSNTRNDESTGRQSTVDMNLIAGVSKSFNIQQPRLKYYDVKAVFFNDLDGNRIKSDNEPPVSNILVNVTKDKSVSAMQGGLPEMDLVSDKNGEIILNNLPEDTYKLSFSPLINLQSFYFLNGSNQSYYNNSNRVIFIPLVESYKIKGKIILNRDPNSSEGKIDLDGVRITATSQNKEVYTVLSDKSGSYILNVPNGDKYTVKINNVFGEQFSIDADEVQIQFTRNKTVNLDFIFTEKRREINFGNGNQLFKFNVNSNEQNSSVTE